MGGRVRGGRWGWLSADLSQYFFLQRRLRTPFSAAEVQKRRSDASLAVLHWWHELPLAAEAEEEEGEFFGRREGDASEWGESGSASLLCASSAEEGWVEWEDWRWHEEEGAMWW